MTHPIYQEGEAMKSLMCLLRVVLQDRSTWCGVSTTHDLKTIERRVEHEGLSFLTMTLPSFCDELQKALAEGAVLSQHFPLWPKDRKGGGGLPLFLGGFLERVFNRATGELLDEPSVDAIQAVRQITLMFGKVGLECSERRTRRAFAKYVECEKEVRETDQSLTEADKSAFETMGRFLWADVLQRVDEDIYYERLVPKHGPGATADRLAGNRKYEQAEWTRRLESQFPHLDGYISPGEWHYRDFDHVDILEPGAERPVRVIAVPKTLKTPRIIAIEPTAMQYTQQAIAETLVEYLEGHDNPFRTLIGFWDQDLNRSMAQKGSLQGSLATLDLSEASDRVSNQLVRSLVTPWPHVGAALDATRSRKADVPGFGVLRLAKYASMGSALCFPIEAMVFATIVMLGIQSTLSRRLTRSDVKSLLGQVRVYGDDIIVPAHFAPAVIQKLEDFGLRVNKDKSFWTGRFRESCGKEYYAGEDVSIVRVRRMLPTSRQDVPELLSAVSLRNQAYKAGIWGLAGALDDFLGDLMGHYPVVAETSPLLGRHSFLGYETQKLDRHTHSPLVKGWRVRAIADRAERLEGYGALMKWYLKRGENPFQDRYHLERETYLAVSTKLGWASPY
jgi:hypothetical protein